MNKYIGLDLNMTKPNFFQKGCRKMHLPGLLNRWGVKFFLSIVILTGAVGAAYAGVDQEGSSPTPISTPTNLTPACDPGTGCDGGKCLGPNQATANPVRYFNGGIDFIQQDIKDPLGMPQFGVTRVYYNWIPNIAHGGTNNGTGQVGHQWYIQQWPYLQKTGPAGSDQIKAVIPPSSTLWFKRVGNGWIPEPYADDVSLVADVANEQMVLTWGNRTYQFVDFVSSPLDRPNPVAVNALPGTFKSFQNDRGITIKIDGWYADGDLGSSANSGGQPKQLVRTFDDNVNLIDEIEYEYANYPQAGGTNPILSGAAWSRSEDGSTFTAIRRVTYDHNELSGNSSLYGILKTATVQRPDPSSADPSSPTWIDTQTSYYEHDGVAGGGFFSLRRVLQPEAYREWQEAVLVNASTPASDYADYTFDYSGKRVIKEKTRSGCASCGGSSSTAGDVIGLPFENTVDYVDGYNRWKTRVKVTYPDGLEEWVWSNHYGKVIFKLFEDSNSTSTPKARWGQYWRYDNDGRVILEAHASAIDVSSIPSTVTSWVPPLDVVNYDQSGSLLKSTSGVLEVTSYYPSTTGSATVSGGHRGAMQYRAIKHGTSGAEVRLKEYEYYSYTVGAAVPANPTNGLVGHWTFDEGAGMSVADSSASGNTGTLVSTGGYTPQWAPGVADGAMSFSAHEEEVSVPDSASLDIAGEITLSAWIHVDDPSSRDWMRIISKHPGPSLVPASNGYEIDYRPFVKRLSFGLTNAIQYVTRLHDLNEGWHHVVGTLTQEGIGYRPRLYVDGQLVPDTTLTTKRVTEGAVLYSIGGDNGVTGELIDGREAGGTVDPDGLTLGIRVNNLPLLIGDNYTDAGSRGRFGGRIDEARVYNLALTTAQVSGLYQWGGAALGRNIHPIAKAIVYPDENDLNKKIITQYSYTYHSGTTSIASKTTTLPMIASAQNGSAVAETIEEVFDLYGNRTWRKDERGSMSRFEYDILTGRIVRRIDDVDTAQTIDEPSGWATVGSSSFGHHLITDYSYDGLSRLVEVLGPEHEVELAGVATQVRSATWTVYDETSPITLNEMRTGGGYAIGSAGNYAYTLVNPVSIRQQGKEGKRTYQSIVATRASTSGKLAEADTFAQPDYVAWAINAYSDDGLMASSDRYHTIPSSGMGAPGTHYDRTTFGYDPDTRNRIMVLAADGTITRTAYITLNDDEVIASTWVGTDDTSATPADPTGGGAGSNNMAKVAQYEYDDGATSGEGDGNLTQITTYADELDPRVTAYSYDWRNRRLAEDGEVDRYTLFTYDNLNRLTRVDRHDTTAVGNLIARSDTKYDDRSRVYQTVLYAVDSATGTVGNSLTGNTWYDPAGNVIKSQAGGSQQFTKNTYDGLGRLTDTYLGYDTAETTYVQAEDVVNDTVVSQSHNTYDAASNVTLVTAYQRNHDTTSVTGILNTYDARVSYQAFWYDGADRPLALANYGTNADVALTRPSTAPSASDIVLVSLTDYDDAGRANLFTDPAGMVTKTFFDDASRQTHVVENYLAGSWTTEPFAPAARPSDVNRVTAYTYTPSGQIQTLTAIDPDADGNNSDNQVTTYVYGTTLQDSDLASNQLLRAVIYPDSDDTTTTGWGDGLTSGTDNIFDRVEIAYNRLGQPIARKDQRETVHAFDYDKLGRLEHDRVTQLGRVDESVDDITQRITRTYEVRGMLDSVSSYDNPNVGSGTISNQVAMAYNNFGQLLSDHQEHAGPIDVNTSAVAYSYAPGTDPAQGIRLEKVTYPNGRELHHLYTNQGDTPDTGYYLSRTTALASDTTRGTNDANVIVAYDYLGANTPVIKTYPTPQISLDYFDSTPDAYTGFDRFGRIIAQRWLDTTNSADVFNINHAYDRASNRLYADNTTYKGASQHYAYDNLHRLTQYKVGQLASAKDDIVPYWVRSGKQYTLDQLGNQKEIALWHADSDMTPADTDWKPWIQNATNAVNEITNRTVRADTGKPPFAQDDFNSNATASHWILPTPDSGTSLDAFDINTTAAGKLKPTTVAKDTFGGYQEADDRLVTFLGEGLVGPFDAFGKVDVDNDGANKKAVIFDYLDMNDYSNASVERSGPVRIHALLNGVQTQEAYTTQTHDGNLEFVSRQKLAAIGTWRRYPDGLPPTRIGLFFSKTAGEFDFINFYEADHKVPLGLRWDNYTPDQNDYASRIENDELLLVGTSGSHARAVILDAKLPARQEITFSVEQRGTLGSASDHNLAVLFNLVNSDDYTLLILRHGQTPILPQRYDVEGGSNGSNMYSHGSNLANVPSLLSTDTLWVRMYQTGGSEYDEFYVKLMKKNTGTPTEAQWTATGWCQFAKFTHISNEGGGGLGFAAGGSFLSKPMLAVDNLTIKTDLDNNGTYETTELIEDFTLDPVQLAGGLDYATVGALGGGLTHDAAGNLTYDGTYAYAYDAWNRLIKVQKAFRDPTGDAYTLQLGSVVATMQYDGLGRRIVKAVQNSATLDATYHYYYNGQQMVETRNGSDLTIKQNVWGLTYIDELIQTSLNDDPADLTEQLCESNFYAMQDANYNVLGMADETGILIERYEYTPYGQRQTYTSSGLNDPLCYAPISTSKPWQIAGIAQPYSLNETGHQGLFHDEEINLIYNRARMLHSTLGRFVQRDPWMMDPIRPSAGDGYQNGMSQYQYVGSKPLEQHDPEGLAWWDWVPFIGTIVNYDIDPWGSMKFHYSTAFAWANDRNCKDLGHSTAEQKCRNEIERQFLKNVGNYIAPSLGRSGAEVVAGGLAAVIAKEAVTRAAAAATGVGAVLAVDGLVNAGITVSKIASMRSAADQALSECKCCP